MSLLEPTVSTSDIPAYVGFICAFVAVVLFGSNFVPVKKFETGNGLFFQWVMCNGILPVGIVINIIRSRNGPSDTYETAPQFYPLVMLGGVIWCIGNVCVVPIIKTIGLGLGICIWATTNLIMGWACGRFGWFGTKADAINDPTLNYIGVGFGVLSALVYVFVKTEVSAIPVEPSEATEPLLGSTQTDSRRGDPFSHTSDDQVLVFNRSRQHSHSLGSSSVRGPLSQEIHRLSQETMIDKLSPLNKRIVGTVLALVSGLFYGVSFMPFKYAMNNYNHSSQNGLDYVFAQYIGLYIMSSVIFLVYCMFTRNRPMVYSRAALPGFISGLMWGMACAAWFVANQVLSMSVAFPIVTSAPPIISTLWGVLWFKEIKGWRNLLILCLGFACTITCGVLAGLSLAN